MAVTTNGDTKYLPTLYGGMDAIANQFLLRVMHRQQRLAANGMTNNWDGINSRRMTRGPSLDERRNIEEECGYPPIDSQIDSHFYRNLWERDPIAARVVEVLPKECWQVQPLVYELEKSEQPTAFEEAWDALGRSLVVGSQGWHQDEKGSPVWEYLLRADILSGIGQYGVILLGLDDIKPNSNADMVSILATPVKGVEEAYSLPIEKDPNNPKKVRVTANALDADGKPNMGFYKQKELGKDFNDQELPEDQAKEEGMVDGKGGGRKLLFMRVFPEYLAPVVQWESNPTSPRYGQPVMYNITFNDYRDYAGVGAPMTSMNVHWTRVVHIADTNHTAPVNDAYAVPRMRPVLNNLLGLHQTYGSDAEMFYQGALPGISFESHPQLGGDVDFDQDEYRDMIENYINSISQRYMVNVGMSAKQLAPQVSDPTPHVEVQIGAICIKLGCPVRVFKGSERGELASSQDDQAWNDRLRQRQNDYVTPRIICQFINRLIMVGVLPKPTATEQDGAPIQDEEGKPIDQEGGKLDDASQLDTIGKEEGPQLEDDKDEEEAGKLVLRSPTGNFSFPPKKGGAKPPGNGFPPKGGPPNGPPQPGGFPAKPPGDGQPAQAGMGPDGKPIPPPPPAKPKALLPSDLIARPHKPGYRVEWPDLTSQSEAEKADIMLKKTQALAAAVGGGVFDVVPPLAYLVHIGEMDEEEAISILESAEKMNEEAHAQETADMEAQGLIEPQEGAKKGEGTPSAGIIQPKKGETDAVQLREGKLQKPIQPPVEQGTDKAVQPERVPFKRPPKG